MNKDYCVYMHTFPNGKRYIGITCCEPNRRWQNGYGYVNQKLIYNAILKYGWNNIEHDILHDGLSLEEANQLEQELIETYDTTNRIHGYNIALGGKAGGCLTQEHKDKIGQANSGKNNGRYGYRYSDEERQQMSLNSVWRGRKHSEESKRKMREYALNHPERYSHKGEKHPMYGKHHSIESRKKQSESAKRRGYCGHKNRMVDMLSLDGEYIKTFMSMEEASRFIKKINGAQNIGLVCKGKRNSAWGYLWRFTDGNESAI